MFINTVSRNSRSELTNIDGKTCNYIPETVNKLVLSAPWAILVKLCEIKHDSSYYSERNSKCYHRLTFQLFNLQVYDKQRLLHGICHIIHFISTIGLRDDFRCQTNNSPIRAQNIQQSLLKKIVPFALLYCDKY